MSSSLDKNVLAGLADLDNLIIPYLKELGTWPYPAAKIGFSAVFYFFSPDVSPKSVITCIEDYVLRFGGELKLWGKASSKHEEEEFFPLDLSTYQLPTEQDIFDPPTQDKRYKKSFYFLSGEESEQYPSHYSLSCTYSYAYEDKDLCRIQFTLPMNIVLSKGAQYISELINQWNFLLKPFHGTGGIGLIYAIEPVLGAVGSGSVISYLERFPGLQSDDPLYDRGRLDDGIKGVSWFTMVSDELLDNIGGKKNLEALDKRIAVWPYPGGVCFIAGALPELGDREQQIAPSCLVSLHKVLRPIYSKKLVRMIAYPPGGCDVIAFTEAWKYRFDSFS